MGGRQQQAGDGDGADKARRQRLGDSDGDDEVRSPLTAPPQAAAGAVPRGGMRVIQRPREGAGGEPLRRYQNCCHGGVRGQNWAGKKLRGVVESDGQGPGRIDPHGRSR